MVEVFVTVICQFCCLLNVSYSCIFTFQPERQRFVSDGSLEFEIEPADTMSLKNYKKTEAVGSH